MSDSIKIATSINYLKKDLQSINGITFLLNNNWTIEDSDNSNPTLPVCFFDVLDMKEICDSEISTKKLLLFNDEKHNKSYMPVVETVADNIKTNPKKYSLDVLIPFGDNLATAFARITAKARFLAGYESTFLGDDAVSNTFINALSYTNSATTIFGNALMTIIDGLYTSWSSSETYDFSYVMRTPNFNKRSLEAMWKNRSILKMKSWEDWEYKNVSILNYQINKKGTEDDYYRATIIVQEMPVLTVVPDSVSVSENERKSDLMSVVAGDSLKAVFNSLNAGEDE